jgi:hypothetical protein
MFPIISLSLVMLLLQIPIDLLLVAQNLIPCLCTVVSAQFVISSSSGSTSSTYKKHVALSTDIMLMLGLSFVCIIFLNISVLFL